MFYWNASDLRSNAHTFWLLLTTNYNRHNRLFSNSIHTNRSHYAADYMLLLQIWRRGVQWSTEVIYVASICLFGWFGWVFGGGKCDEHPRHPSMQRIPAWCCVCLLPISSENRLYKEVIRPSDKTKWHWKERSLGTIRRLISAFKCCCFPNEW